MDKHIDINVCVHTHTYAQHLQTYNVIIHLGVIFVGFQTSLVRFQFCKNEIKGVHVIGIIKFNSGCFSRSLMVKSSSLCSAKYYQPIFYFVP